MLLSGTGDAQMAYAQVQAEANASVSSSFELICMLHDKLIDSIDGMIAAIERNDFEAKAKCADKAIEILSGLDASMDLSSESELIERIHQLYLYSISTIGECSISKDVELLASVRLIVTDLRDGWSGAMEIIDG